MKIGYLLPANFAFSSVNGVRQEANLKAEWIKKLGHEVIKMSSWEPLHSGEIDLVHAFYGGLPLSGLEYSARTYKKVFSTIIDSNQGYFSYRVAAEIGCISSRFYTIQGEFLKQCKAADTVVVRSEHEKKRVIHGLGVEKEKVRIVRLGVDFEDEMNFFDSNEREGIFHLSTFGQARKNVFRLIDAIGPTGLPLVIAGASTNSERLRVIKYSEKYSNIRVLTELSSEEKLDYFKKSRVFVLPSLNEGTGLSALEAATYGCEVVITQNGGPPDYFYDLGYLVDPYSVSDIRKSVVDAYRSNRAMEISKISRERFSMEKCAKELLDIYKASI